MSSASQGTVLAGRYRLERRIQTDPDGSLWRARDATLDRLVVVRVLRPGHPFAADVADAARRAALVDDPRLVRVLDVGSDGNVGFVVNENVNGESLAATTERGPLPGPAIRRIVGEVAEGLAGAAARGLHHLRLTPRSVMICADGSVKLIGTAVEAAAAGLEPDHAASANRADAVGLIALIYSGLTGRWPLGDAGFPPAPHGDSGPVAPAELLRGVPNDLDTLCAVTLGPYNDGPRSPGEVARQLAPWPSAEQIAAAAATPPRRPNGETSPPATPAGRASATTPSPSSSLFAPTTPVSPDATRDARRASAPSPPAPSSPGQPSPARAGGWPAGRTAGAAAPVDGAPGRAPGQAAAGGPVPPGAARPRGWQPVPETVAPPGRPIRPAGASAPPASAFGQTGFGQPSDQALSQTPSSRAPSGAAAATQPLRTPGPNGRPNGVRPEAAAGAAPRAPRAPKDKRGHSRQDKHEKRGHERQPLDTGEMLMPWAGTWTPAPQNSIPAEATGPFPILIPADPPPHEQSRLVIVGVAAALVLGLVLAVFSLRDFGGSGDPRSSAVAPLTSTSQPTAQPQDSSPVLPAQTATAASPTPAAAKPVIGKIRAIDPLGDKDENTADSPKAVDGNPSTQWRSSSYGSPAFGGLKKGLGLAIGLQKPARISSVEIDIKGSGGTVQLRGGNTADYASATVLDSAAINGGTVKLTSTATARYSYVIIWFTKLPSSGGKNRAEVSEVRVT